MNHFSAYASTARRRDNACPATHEGTHPTDALLLDIIDTAWTRMRVRVIIGCTSILADRDDNLLCAAVVLETALVVKTVMHHWEPMP